MPIFGTFWTSRPAENGGPTRFYRPSTRLFVVTRPRRIRRTRNISNLLIFNANRARAATTSQIVRACFLRGCQALARGVASISQVVRLARYHLGQPLAHECSKSDRGCKRLSSLRAHVHADVHGSGVARPVHELFCRAGPLVRRLSLEPSRNPVIVVPQPVVRRRRTTAPAVHCNRRSADVRTERKRS